MMWKIFLLGENNRNINDFTMKMYTICKYMPKQKVICTN